MAILSPTTQHSADGGDVTLVITERNNAPYLNAVDDSKPSYQAYVSRKYTLHRKIVCDGPRSSKMLQTLLDTGTEEDPYHARLELDMTEQNAHVFPQLLDYMYEGETPSQEDQVQKSLVQLAKRFGVNMFPSSDSSTKEAGEDYARPNVEETCAEGEISDADKQEPALTPQDGIKCTNMFPSDSSSKEAGEDETSPNEDETNLEEKEQYVELENSDPEEKELQDEIKYSISELPDLLRTMKSDNKETLVDDIKAILSAEDLDIEKIVNEGSILCLLQILSDDIYSPLQLSSLELIERIAKHSEDCARRLVASFAVDQLLLCQLVSPIPMRVKALDAIGAIAHHSEELAGMIFEAPDCLKSLAVAMNMESDDMVGSGLYIGLQFAKYFPSKIVMSKDLLEGLTNNCHIYNERNAMIAMEAVLFVGGSMEETDDASHCIQDAIPSIISSFDGRYGSLQRKLFAIDLVSKLVHKKFVLRKVTVEWVGQNMAAILWSPEKEVQVRACSLMAAFAKSMRGNEHREGIEWCNETILPPLVSLLSHHGGTMRLDATRAVTELVIHSTSTAIAFVKCNGIRPLCEVLTCDEIRDNNNSDVKMNILLALQSVLAAATEEAEFPEHDVLHVVGTNLARCMLELALLENGNNVYIPKDE